MIRIHVSIKTKDELCPDFFVTMRMTGTITGRVMKIEGGGVLEGQGVLVTQGPLKSANGQLSRRKFPCKQGYVRVVGHRGQRLVRILTGAS